MIGAFERRMITAAFAMLAVACLIHAMATGLPAAAHTSFVIDPTVLKEVRHFSVDTPPGYATAADDPASEARVPFTLSTVWQIE